MAHTFDPEEHDGRFAHVLAEMLELHNRKGADYGRTEDPFANVRGSEDFGISPWVGAMVRANDKMRRLQKAARGGTLENESIEDSLIDLAVYSVIGLILFREEAAAFARLEQAAILARAKRAADNVTEADIWKENE